MKYYEHILRFLRLLLNKFKLLLLPKTLSSCLPLFLCLIHNPTSFSPPCSSYHCLSFGPFLFLFLPSAAPPSVSPGTSPFLHMTKPRKKRELNILQLTLSISALVLPRKSPTVFTGLQWICLEYLVPVRNHFQGTHMLGLTTFLEVMADNPNHQCSLETWNALAGHTHLQVETLVSQLWREHDHQRQNHTHSNRWHFQLNSLVETNGPSQMPKRSIADIGTLEIQRGQRFQGLRLSCFGKCTAQMEPKWPPPRKTLSGFSNGPWLSKKELLSKWPSNLHFSRLWCQVYMPWQVWQGQINRDSDLSLMKIQITWPDKPPGQEVLAVRTL